MLKPYNRAELSFQLQTEIGQEGRNSQVWTAHDPQLDANIVIKKVQKQAFADPNGIIDSNSFFKESSILYSGAHPNVVEIHYACQDADHIYLAMPFYGRGSLSRLMATRFLTLREVIRCSTQFLTGLHNIHSKGLIHFDVKPDNIMLSDSNEALLSDFGLCRRTAPDGTSDQNLVYPLHRVPESFSTMTFTRAFDIYQVGLTLYRMCNGSDVFKNQINKFGTLAAYNTAIQNGSFPDRNEFLWHIPLKIQRAINKCLEVDPNNRFGSVIDIVNELADVKEELLDWQYHATSAGQSWTKVVGASEYKLVVTPQKEAIATRKSATRVQRIAKFTKQRISITEVRSFLGEF